jgi:ribonuclease HII
MDSPNQDYEQIFWSSSKIVAGIDEAGRGPLAGPVVAAAVILNSESLIIGLNDSKKLTDKARRKLFESIYKNALDINVGFVYPEEIDEINILQASVKAMKIACEGLRVVPNHLLIDGNYFTEYDIPYITIVKGDGISISIAAASIVAKVTRDDWMINNAHSEYPDYGFDKHKGYPTELHYNRINKFGICPIHRKSFLTSKAEVQTTLF